MDNQEIIVVNKMDNAEITSFRRQLFILSAFLFGCFNDGVIMSYPGVLNYDLLSPNCTEGITATKEEISWIASVIGITVTSSYVFLPLIMDSFGRKSVNLVLNIALLIGWVIIIFAKNITWLAIGRSIQMIKLSGMIIALMTVGEYVDPARRGYFAVLKLAAMSFGVLTCHVMSTFCTWRQIAVFCLFPSFCAAIIVPFWPESPPYLAMKGKFEECEKSYVWLNGKSSINNRELVELIAVQKSKWKRQQKISRKLKISRFFKSITSKELLKPTAIITLITIILEASGRHYFVVYLIQIMTELVEDLSLAIYCSIAVDTIVLFASCGSVILIKKVNRRTLLFSSVLIAATILFFMSVLVFLKSSLDVFKDSPVFIPIILVIYCFFLNIGVSPILITLAGEIFPLKFRAYGSLITGFGINFGYSLALKYIPIIIENLGLTVLYAMSASVMLIALVLLYFILPETKDRNLQDIEFDITGEKLCIVENTPMIVSKVE